MVLRFIAVITFTAVFGVTGSAQPQYFDKLQLPSLPAGWSKQEQPHKVVYSNYNLPGSTPLTLTVFRSASAEKKPELLFAQCWRQCLQLADTATAPKPRRLYTFDGESMVNGAAETDGPLGKGYYLLTLYGTAQWLQPVLLFTTSAKEYKVHQYEWMERLQSVKFIQEK